ncbi:MAG: M67 family metallopeptidase [Chloroflexi bacterium]|nr:M67 family metallopeptidase [Chloroflexota bacterium]
MFRLGKHYTQEMIDHARAEAPNECCGILAGKDDKVEKLYRGINADGSPVRYKLDSRQQFRIYREIEDNGWDVLGVYHSHTHTQAYPSATDVELAFWPDSLYFIISLQDPTRPLLRAFHIREGKIEEEILEIV